jgi:hypothetical protein
VAAIGAFKEKIGNCRVAQEFCGYDLLQLLYGSVIVERNSKLMSLFRLSEVNICIERFRHNWCHIFPGIGLKIFSQL